MKFPKRILVWLLTVTMLCSLSGITAFAEEVDNPEIGNPAVNNVDGEIGPNASTDIGNPPGNLDDEDDLGGSDVPVTLNLDDGEPSESDGLPESTHPYENSCDEEWNYNEESATNGIYVTFDEQTQTESGYDYIYVYDGNGSQIGQYSGTELAGSTLYVPTATVKIRLTSDRTSNAWGFKVSAIEAVGDSIDLSKVGSVDEIAPVHIEDALMVTVKLNGVVLEQDTDYTVSYNSSTVGSSVATITGMGKYSGELIVPFTVYDDENKAEAPTVSSENILLRQAGAEGTSYVSVTDGNAAWASRVTSLKLTPVDLTEDENGNIESETNTGTLTYPNAPKEITLGAEDITATSSGIQFKRTAEEPVVYVMENHQPIDIVGRWSTTTYPQSQTYKVTITATGYEDAVGYTTYYTGTSADFSVIVVEEDGTEKTAKTWSYEDLEEMAEFANGSSQCGMTGFRTFSGYGVSLKDLLKDAGVSVSETDSFTIDTSDHYGNNQTYASLFGTDRYFMSSIYDKDFVEVYNSLVNSDDSAGSTIALRRYLAEHCTDDDIIEPRICTQYSENLIYGDQLKDVELPTEENTYLDSLVSYENQYRFIYGIALTQDECKVTFDSQGGSEVDSQTVLSHLMTSTENTTIRSSYWANSLIVYRGRGTAAASSAAAEKISVPEAPTREGYVFAGWYTDEGCTDGNRFDFTANDGTVDQNTTLYAKWIPEAEAITITDFSITSAEHNDADEELNQTIIATITFSDDIEITDDLKDDLLITIVGTDVYNTARDITYEVQNGNQLVIKLVSNDWVAIMMGNMAVKERSVGSISHIVAAKDSDKTVVWTDQASQIPIGIVVSNDAIEGTASKSASTYVSVDHKANMRGMYYFELVSIVDGKETVIGKSVSHAHAFYTTVDEDGNLMANIDEAAIASAMAAALNNYDGYSTKYNDGDTYFIVSTDNAVEGEILAVRMYEDKAQINYSHAPSETVIENKVEATATTAGSYDVVTYCSFCGDELNRETVVIPAIGTVDDNPVVNPPADDNPVVNPPADDNPVVNPPADDNPIVNPPADDNPVVNPPVNDNPSVPGNVPGNAQPTNTANNQADNNSDTTVSAKTGDTTNAGIWGAVLAICAGAVCVTVSRKRKVQ